ncbi:hypothetical protein V2J09_023994 [Rumex salicifolius]
MAMLWSFVFWIAKMVWMAMAGLIAACFVVADDIAASLRSGDIGAFHCLTTMLDIQYQHFQNPQHM